MPLYDYSYRACVSCREAFKPRSGSAKYCRACTPWRKSLRSSVVKWFRWSCVQPRRGPRHTYRMDNENYGYVAGEALIWVHRIRLGSVTVTALLEYLPEQPQNFWGDGHRVYTSSDCMDLTVTVTVSGRAAFRWRSGRIESNAVYAAHLERRGEEAERTALLEGGGSCPVTDVFTDDDLAFEAMQVETERRREEQLERIRGAK